MAQQFRRELTIVLTGDAKGLTGTVRVSREELKQLGQTLDETAEKGRKAGKAIDDSGKSIQRFGKIVGIAVGAAAVGFTLLLRNQLQVADQAGKMAQRLGVSTEFITGAGYAARASGADMAVLTQSLEHLTTAQVRAAQGQKLSVAAFRDLGINVRDAAGHLRGIESLLPEIADRFSKLADGPAKSAVAIRLFGEQGTRLIPLLNQGAAGMAALAQEAANLGLVIDQQTAAAATEFNDRLDRMKALASGLANEFLRDTLPAFAALAGGIGDAKAQGESMNETARVMSNTIKGLALVVIGLKNVVEALAISLAAVVIAMKTQFVAGLDIMRTSVSSTVSAITQAMSGDIPGALQTYEDGLAHMRATSTEARRGLEDNWKTLKDALSDQFGDMGDAYDKLFGEPVKATTKEAANATEQLAISTRTATVADKAAVAQRRALASATDAYVKKILALEDANDDARAKLSGLTAAQLSFRAGMRDAVRAYDDYIAKGRGMANANALLARNVAALRDQYELNTAATNQAAKAATDLGDVQTTQTSTAERYYQVLADGARSVADTVGRVLVRSIRTLSDAWRGLTDIAKTVVAQIISTWLQLRVLQPLLGSIFGGGGYGSALGAIGSYFAGGSGGGVASAAGTYAGAGGGGGGGAGGLLQIGTGAYKAYNAYTSGGLALTGGTVSGNSIVYGQTAGGVFGTNVPGGVAYGGVNGGAVGYSTAYSPAGGVANFGGYSAPVASVGGGLLGAYYGSKQGGGGFSTVASTVSYGALGAGIAGTAAGVAGGASVGAAAGSAFGAAAAGTSWIPVVGWILAALALVDAVSGGKLFGTKYRPTAAATSLNLSATGATAQQFLTEQKQRALFGGRKVRTNEVTPSAEVQDAAQQLYDNIRKSMVQGAQKLASDVPDMITASLRIESKLNDKGQVRSTKYLVEYLGKTWEEATAEAAAQRIGAEALVATVAESAGAVAQTIAEQWRDSAETLMDGAQTMLAAQADIVHGNQLLAVGTQGTLSDVIDLVKRMQEAGQSLADTYARLASANAQYLQFVAQFEPQSTRLGGALASIHQAMLQDIAQANALAQAAGLQGAREEDLANIHQHAAQLAANAIAQLNDAASTLASKLYGVTGQTVAALNSQIASLQGTLQAGLGLALGDLSPYSDQQKLDLALKGLRSGTTSAEQVLTLGRQLYATGSDYNGLYDKVNSILGLPGNNTGDLSAGLDQLNGLQQRRDHVQSIADAAQRTTDAQTLASYVADLAQQRGQGFGDVASSLGFSLQDLASDLGVSDIRNYLQDLQQQDLPGTLGEASTEIVDAIRGIGREIVQAITGGPVTAVGPTPGVSANQGVYMTAEQLREIHKTLKTIEQHTGSTAGDTKQVARNGKLEQLRLNQDRRLPPVSAL